MTEKFVDVVKELIEDLEKTPEKAEGALFWRYKDRIIQSFLHEVRKER